MRNIDSCTTERIGYDFYCDIAQRMVEGRTRKGWTQEQLAQKSDVRLSRISEMELVKFRFRLPDVERIAKALDVSVDWLIQAEIDDQAGECRYLVWAEQCPDIKLYQDATSRRMAFFKLYERLKGMGIRFLDARERAIVQLVGIPVTRKRLEAKFPKCGAVEDDPVVPRDGDHSSVATAVRGKESRPAGGGKETTK